MKDTVEKDLDTPEARDALRLKALPMLLAIEVAHEQNCLQEEELISHDDLEDKMLRRLGLELCERPFGLFDQINELMCGWHWQWVTWDSGMQHFYARPAWRRASMVKLWGNRVVLQADQYFPNDEGDIVEDLWESDFASTFIQPNDEKGSSWLKRTCDNETLINAYLEAHLVYPQPN